MRAARILNMSYLELDESPRIAELMKTAATIERGESDGSYLREVNPEYVKQRAKMQAEIKKANG